MTIRDTLGPALLAALLGASGCAGETLAERKSKRAQGGNGAAALAEMAEPVDPGDESTLDPVLNWIGDREVVLMGEASHGTHEFYEMRADLTQRLIEQGRLDAIFIEGDWASTRELDRYVRGVSDYEDAAQALNNYTRFPRWMWRNEVVRDFAEWLHDHNAELPFKERVGFYGVDVYAPEESARNLLEYAETTDPALANLARESLSCVVGDGSSSEPARIYLQTLQEGSEQRCMKGLATLVAELESRAAANGDTEADFNALRNAEVIRGSQAYWHAQMTRSEPSWNVRDRHMAEVVDSVRKRLAQQLDRPARVAIWAHNSHLGDARATQMSTRGELNLGQLMREMYGDAVFSLGFSTYDGTVRAADDWGRPGHVKSVNPGREDSYEGLMHQVAEAARYPAFALPLMAEPVRAILPEDRLYRAIGVIYRPQTERWSHYFGSNLAEQFDALIHVDTSSALEPLAPSPDNRVKPAA